jgi:hypothetical protein
MIAKVKSQWDDGDLVFTNFEGTEIARFNAEEETLEIKKATLNGASIASGEQVALIADIGEEATGAQIATAVNALIAAVQAFGIVATE